VSNGVAIAVSAGAGALRNACEEGPDAFAREHLATFPLDVRRRRPSVEKARRLLGWEAQTDLPAGTAATVRWLREREVSKQ
jgi:nucleoside-diphosphate-sugar epimerase